MVHDITFTFTIFRTRNPDPVAVFRNTTKTGRDNTGCAKGIAGREWGGQGQVALTLRKGVLLEPADRT